MNYSTLIEINRRMDRKIRDFFYFRYVTALAIAFRIYKVSTVYRLS